VEHKKISSDNGEVHYWIEKHKNSDAKCIVFTHGVTANYTMFEKQVDFFQQNFTVITWDIPLHGLSRPYLDFSYCKTAMELKNILDNEYIKKVILVGMSMGGYPSQMFADLYPNMVEGFVALDTTPFGMEYYSKSDLWWLKKVASMAQAFSNNMLRKSMAKSVSLTKYSYNKMLEMLEPLTKQQIIEQMSIAYGEFAVENKDMNFSFPVLILLGENDNTGKVKQYCQAWSSNAGYPLHIIKNAAHFSNGDNYEQVNSEIEMFINRL